MVAIIATLGVAALAPAQQRRGWGNGGDRERRSSSDNATTNPATSRPVDAYASVVERNIFLRDRKPPVVVDNRPPASRPYVPPPTLEASLVLRGVVLEDDQFHAYFENEQSHEMVRVIAGDPLAKGRVADISIDALEFETAAGPMWIKIGDNLAGAHIAEPPPSDSSSSTSTSSTQTSSPTTTNPALMSIEERMRQRRQQRGGGGR